jgi:hypothetical protein
MIFSLLHSYPNFGRKKPPENIIYDYNNPRRERGESILM